MNQVITRSAYREHSSLPLESLALSPASTFQPQLLTKADIRKYSIIVVVPSFFFFAKILLGQGLFYSFP